jgi:hypothetical protein
MKRKTVHISLPEEIYFKLQDFAKKEHLRLSTWIRQMILKKVNNNGGERTRSNGS